VHVEQAPRLSVRRDALSDDFLRLISRLRWRLGAERLLQFGIRGVIGSGAALLGVAALAWLDAGLEALVWLAAAPFLAALALAVVRWPSRREAALAADRRLRLDDRLATAVELLSIGHAGRFVRLQVSDALAHAQSARPMPLLLSGRARVESVGAAVALAIGLAAWLLLPTWPHPGVAAADRAVSTDVAFVDELADRALPEETPDLALADAQPIQQAQADAGLATRVQSEQAERSALDRLAQALGSVSAGQGAADAIEQGNFDAARDQLQNLGEEADQLSDAAKQQLARALQQAAAATAQTDRQLSDRERQAAQALSRATYSDQRSALRSLADQIERSGTRSVSPDQLARDLGQLQQQRGGAASAGTGARGQNPAAGNQPGATTGTQPGALPSDATQAAGGQGGTPDGQQGGAGIGTGTTDSMFGNPSRLDSAGQQVQVPTRLGQGPGVRPADGTEDQVGADPSLSGQSVSELAQAQQTGQVAPEQNLVPGEQRPVVRGYFR
jgi:hypothetical protein